MKQTLFRALLVTALLCGFAACGGGGGSGPGDGSGDDPAASAMAALAEAHAAAIAAHAKVYDSLDAFAPAIGELFASTKRAAAKGGVLCVPLEIADTVFDYDTETMSYVATQESGAPAGGVRFKLYEVDENGDPAVPLIYSGFADLSCDDVTNNPILSACNAAAQPVFELAINVFSVSPPEYIITTSEGRLFDATSENTIGFLVTAEGALNQSMKFGVSVSDGLEYYDPQATGIRVTAGLWDVNVDANGAPLPPYYVLSAGVSKSDASQNVSWNAAVGGNVTGEGTLLNIVQGDVVPMEFENYAQTSNGILACFSGHYKDPLVQSSAADCAIGTIKTPIPLSATSLAAIHDGYVAMVELLEAMSRGFAAVVPLIVR